MPANAPNMKPGLRPIFLISMAAGMVVAAVPITKAEMGNVAHALDGAIWTPRFHAIAGNNPSGAGG